MKNIEIDEELYQYIASNTQYIGESASSILRRLLAFSSSDIKQSPVLADDKSESITAEVEEPLIDLGKDEEASLPEFEVVSEQLSNEASIVKEKLDDASSVFNYINKEEMAMQRGAVGRFLLILAALYRVHGEAFSVVYEIRGRDRLYFADSEAALEQSGSSTKPRQIPESPYWVITNSNTTRKKMMLTEASKSLGYTEEEVEKIRDLL